MTSATPLSYNAFIQQIAAMGVYTVTSVAGVNQITSDPSIQSIVPMILNYAELRCQRDLNLLSSETSNTYTLTAGQNVFSLPPSDFLKVRTLEICQTNNGQVVNATPLLFTSKEFIQNCYSGLASANAPQYCAMYGDNFGDEQDSATNILLGPVPNYSWTLRVTGAARQPSLYSNASAGIADTEYTYLSQWYPDLLVIASMIYISGYQRNWSATADDTPGAQSWEKQYQALRLGAISEEDERRQNGSAWTAYSTPTSATPTR
jgi:hypothetical protein